MSFTEPLLNSVETQERAAPASTLQRSRTSAGPSKKGKAPKPATQFEKLIAEREQQGIWEFFRKEGQNIKEIEVLDLLIQRLSHHTASMGYAQVEYKVIARLRDVGVELHEFSKRLENIPVLKLFVEDLEAVKGFAPLPTALNMKNFLKGVDVSFDSDLKITDLDERDELDEFDPEGDPDADPKRDSGDSDQESESDSDGSEDDDSSEGGDEEQKEEDDDDDESKIKPADLMVKYTVRQLRNELRQLGEDMNVGTQKETAEALAKRLADALNRRKIETLLDFGFRWWEWKKKQLKDAESAVVERLCDDVSNCVTSRLGTATPKFNKFPVCGWFKTLLTTSVSEQNHFGLLQMNFTIPDDQYTRYLPEGMAWTQFGVLAQDMIRLGLLEEVATANGERDFQLAIADIHSRMLPAFILKLTRLKAIMASQVVTTDQMRNKILAAAVTGAMAVMSVGMHVVARDMGVSDGGPAD